MWDFLLRESQIEDLKEETKVIEVKHVTKKYGNFTAVNDINFTIKDDEIVGFLGPNGAGKSTTMNMITGCIEPTSGKIIVNDYDISKYPQKVKRQIGYMPESTPLYSELTVREFINYMADLKYVKRKEKKEKVDKVLKEVGLTNVQKKLIKNLSRGYKQRVSLAGALIGNPKVLILDNPTQGVDVGAKEEIYGIIEDLADKGVSVIVLSSEAQEIIRVASRCFVLYHGRIMGELRGDEMEEERMMRLATGVEE